MMSEIFKPLFQVLWFSGYDGCDQTPTARALCWRCEKVPGEQPGAPPTVLAKSRSGCPRASLQCLRACHSGLFKRLEWWAQAIPTGRLGCSMEPFYPRAPLPGAARGHSENGPNGLCAHSEGGRERIFHPGSFS